MTKRRPLTAGVKPPPKLPPEAEEAFVFGTTAKPTKPKTARTAPVKTPTADDNQPTARAEPVATEVKAAIPAANRSPLTTRIRADLAQGLKRASLERQLSGEKPSAVQELIEAALEPWLKERGYLK
jgi:hypothetical protein